MTAFEYGPVEIFVVEFEGARPDPGVFEAILDLTRSGVVRLLDTVIAARQSDGSIIVVEVSEESDRLGLIDAELEIEGLLGEEDIAEAIESIEPGSSVAIVALELTWAITLAERLANARGKVVRSERIPAPVINELVSAAAESND